MTFTPCACCRADCYPDEFRADDYTQGAAIEAQFGGPVCYACMETLVQPEDGDGEFVLRSETTEEPMSGTFWLSSYELHLHRRECDEWQMLRSGR